VLACFGYALAGQGDVGDGRRAASGAFRLSWGTAAAAEVTEGPATVVDRVIAVVDKEIITETELLAEARIALVLRAGLSGLGLMDGEVDPGLLLSMRTYVINQVLVAHQVRRLGGVGVSEQEVDHALRGFVMRFGSTAAYDAFRRKFDVSEQAVRAVLRRDLRNAKYVDQRMRSWLATADDGDSEEERRKQALASWLEEVQRAVEIRMLGPEGELERLSQEDKRRLLSPVKAEESAHPNEEPAK